ncbi:MAG: TaqI-like C-terminal specificity domain-containing protein, partial [Succinivibrio sp.]
YKRHFRLADALAAKRLPQFTVALGCPPRQAQEGGMEPLCDLFIRRALEGLPQNGIMRFLLPQMVLRGRTHEAARRAIGSCARVTEVDCLPGMGGAGGQEVLLTCQKDPAPAFAPRGVKVNALGRSFTIMRPMPPGDFSFDTDDTEHELLEAIGKGSRLTLRGRAEFGIGIVTGDNRSLVRKEPGGGAESVLRGSCVSAFRITPRGEYIVFDRSRFQQSPALELFRRGAKILYRFVADSPVAAVDTQGRLTLNSCNFIIPRGDEAECRYVAAVLNSAVVRFYFKKRFGARKILRSHLEALPLPGATRAQMEQAVELSGHYYEKPGRLAYEQGVARLYGLTDRQFSAVMAALEGGRDGI